MRKVTAVILIAVVIAVVLFSIYSDTSIPPTTMTAFYPSQLIQQGEINLNFGNVSFSYAGQHAVFYIAGYTLTQNWSSDSSFGTIIITEKLSQNLSFPFTNASVWLGQITVTADGVPVGLNLEGTSKMFNDTALSYDFTSLPTNSYMGRINIALAAHFYFILYSSIYHFSVDEGTMQLSTTLILS